MTSLEPIEIPPNWAWATVREILEVNYGKGLTKVARDVSGDIPVYGSNGVVGRHIQALTGAATIIIGRKGGAGAVHFSEVPCWVIDTAYFTEPSGELSAAYLYYVLKTLRLDDLDKSTAIPSLSRDDLYSQYLPIPPFNEQRRIVEAIETQFTRLDAGIATLKRLRTKLKRYKVAVLKAACEGKLVLQDPNDEPANVSLGRLHQRNEKEWTSDGLPLGWAWASIGEITECLDRFRRPVNKQDRAQRKGEIPYYGANGLVGWIDEAIFNEPLVLVVEDETFTGREKPFSYKISGKSWVNNHAHVLRPREVVDIEYLNYALAYYPFTPLTTGTTGRKKLTQKALMAAPLALPPLAEQVRIVREVEGILTSCEYVLDATPNLLTRTEQLRQSILREAFAGRLVPQDPNDEPASELLKRIRAEREAKLGNGKQQKQNASSHT